MRSHFTARAPLLLALFLTAFPAVSPALTTYNWLGGTGDWFDPSEWSTGQVPHPGPDLSQINIDAGNPVLSSVTASLPIELIGPSNFDPHVLTIDSGDALSIAGINTDAALRFVINGSLSDSAEINGPYGLVLEGTGEAVFTENAVLRSGFFSGIGHMSIGQDLTVRNLRRIRTFVHGPIFATNAGTLITPDFRAEGLFNFHNAGRIQATNLEIATLINEPEGIIEIAPGGTLVIVPSFYTGTGGPQPPVSLQNQGTIIARNANVTIPGGLEGNFDVAGSDILSFGPIMNAGRTLEIDNRLRLDQYVLRIGPEIPYGPGSVDGGILRTTGNGRIELSSGARLKNLTLEGHATGFGNSFLGNVTMAPGASFTSLPQNDPQQPLGASIIVNEGTTNLGGLTLLPGATLRGDFMIVTTDSFIQGDAVLEVDSFISEGRVRPGVDVGSMTITGDATLNHTLTIEVGPSASDVLHVNGRLVLTEGALLEVLPLPDASPGPHIIATYGSLEGTFRFQSGNFSIDYSTPGQISITLIPEPSLLLAFLLYLYPALRLQNRSESL